MNDDIRKERERKDAELYEQEQQAPDDSLPISGYDKTDADSFPASDPPPAK